MKSFADVTNLESMRQASGATTSWLLADPSIELGCPLTAFCDAVLIVSDGAVLESKTQFLSVVSTFRVDYFRTSVCLG